MDGHQHTVPDEADAMSYQRPIFNNGLFGKANAFVMNGFVDSAAALQLESGK